MARKIKIQARSVPSIQEAFNDFLLHKKACGIAEKTYRTYSEQFAAICKHIDSSVPITSLVKRQLEDQAEASKVIADLEESIFFQAMNIWQFYIGEPSYENTPGKWHSLTEKQMQRVLK